MTPKHTLLILLSLSLAACASMQGGKTQEILIKSTPKDAACVVSNDKGAWHVQSPDTVTVQRDSSDIKAVCTKGKLKGSFSQKSGASPNMGKVGLIGDLYDLHTGAAYEYPSVVDVNLK